MEEDAIELRQWASIFDKTGNDKIAGILAGFSKRNDVYAEKLKLGQAKDMNEQLAQAKASTGQIFEAILKGIIVNPRAKQR